MSKISILKSTTPEGRDVFLIMKDIPLYVLDESIIVKYMRDDAEIDDYIFAMDSMYVRGLMINGENVVAWILEPYDGDISDYVEDKWGFSVRLEKYLRTSPEGMLIDYNEEKEKEIAENTEEFFYWFELYWKPVAEL